MFELVRECVEDDRGEAWGDLWQLYFQIATPTARRRLMRLGFCAEDAEDIVMESMLSLCVDSYSRLKSFRGESQWELCVWFRRIVQNQSCNWLVRSGRRNVNAQSTALEFIEASASPLDLDVEVFLCDLAECVEIVGFPLSSIDMRHLRIVAGLDPVPSGTSQRTIRHWKQTLLSKVELLV